MALQADGTYVVEQGDTLSSIVVKLGLSPAPATNTLADWMPALEVAKKIADLNGIPWAGPPTWAAPISPGQVLKLPAGMTSATPGSGSSMGWGFLLVLGGVGLLFGLSKSKYNVPMRTAPALGGARRRRSRSRRR